MHPLELLVVGATGLVAAYVGGVAGLGSGIVLLPVLVLYMGVKQAIPVLAITLVAAGLSRVGVTWRSIDFRIVRWTWTGSLPATAVGAWLFTVAPSPLLTRAIGCLLLALLAWRRLRVRPMRIERPAWFLPLGMGYGVLAGLASGIGPLMAPFYLAAGLRRAAYVGTAALVSLGMQAMKLTVFGKAHILTPQVIGFGLFLIPIIVLGTMLARRTLERLPDHVFVAIIETIMLVGGIVLLLKG